LSKQDTQKFMVRCKEWKHSRLFHWLATCVYRPKSPSKTHQLMSINSINLFCKEWKPVAHCAWMRISQMSHLM